MRKSIIYAKFSMIYNLAIILPAFRETFSIAKTIESLLEEFDSKTTFIIVDDSPDAVSAHFASLEFAEKPEYTWHKITSGTKRGRGSSVKEGFEFVQETYGEIPIIEMDSDGSHSAHDVKRIFNLLIAGNDFVVGSRYMEESSINGWPKIRRVFSRLLNFLLRKIFGINLSDWTNGLRGYSSRAVRYLLEEDQIVDGFTYLSEQVLCLAGKKIMPIEIPTHFQNRTHGESSVGLNELRNSLIGILQLMRRYR